MTSSRVQLSLGFPLAVATRTDVGLVRSNNEDSTGRVWLDDGMLLVVVADGMGGHQAGEVASGLAVQVIEDVISHSSSDDPRERIYRSLTDANDAIVEEGKQTGLRGMGTTAVVTLIRGHEAFCGLVGDSRIFHVRAGHLMWRTRDHTRVQNLIDKGEISDAEARLHPDSGMLTRALGHPRMANGRPLVPEVLAEPIALDEGDVLVLSSDGLHDLVDDWEIAKCVSDQDPDTAAQVLVDLALERGGHDNVTVAVIVAGARASAYDPSFAYDMGVAPTADIEMDPSLLDVVAAALADPVEIRTDPVADAASPVGWVRPSPVGSSPASDPRVLWVIAAAAGLAVLAMSAAIGAIIAAG